MWAPFSSLSFPTDRIIPSFALIFQGCLYRPDSVLGGSLGALVITGVRRAAFSNEAGIGTAPMAHGAAKTNEPVREGLVAMMGPVVDTIIVCTMTALALIITGVWNSGESDGITLTAEAFEQSMPGVGVLPAHPVCDCIFRLNHALFPILWHQVLLLYIWSQAQLYL